MRGVLNNEMASLIEIIRIVALSLTSHDTCIFIIVHGSSTGVATSRNLDLLLGHIPSHAMQGPCKGHAMRILLCCGGFLCISTYFTCPCCLGMFGGNGAKRFSYY